MTITPVVLFGPIQIGNVPVTLYTQPAGIGFVKEVVFTNVTAGTVALTVWIVRSGHAAGATNIVIGAAAAGFALTSGQAYIAQELANLVLVVGDAIVAESNTATSINCVGSGWTQ